MASSRDVEFKTYDGIKLRGTLFPAGEKKPCIIMNAGVSIPFIVVRSKADFSLL